MSLLNEMLHDLAKNKPSNQSRPLLTASLSQQQSKGKKLYLLAGLGLILLLFLAFQLKTLFQPKAAETSKKEEPHFNALKNTVPPSQLALSSPEILLEPTPAQAPKAAKPVLVKKVSVNSVNYKKQVISLESEMDRALLSIKNGDLNDAKACLQSIIAKDPSEIKAREHLASIYLTYGHFEHAMRELEEGLEYAPDNPKLITLKARVLIKQGLADEAIALLKNDHPSIASHPEFYATLAFALETQGHNAEASSYYKSLTKLDPNNGRYWLGYGLALEKSKQKDLAIDAYKRASQTKGTALAVRQKANHQLETLLG